MSNIGFHLIDRGYLTLQIADEQITIAKDRITKTKTIAPDDFPKGHAAYLHNNRFALGREKGFLHWTRLGYESNKDIIKQKWESQGKDWDEFEKFAEHFFHHLNKANKKYKKDLQQKIECLQRMMDETD